MVWFSQSTTKHSFILWLAVQGKLLTQDRMMSWHQGEDLKCSLWSNINDSHQHLFFECEFSKQVWKEVKTKGRFLEEAMI